MSSNPHASPRRLSGNSCFLVRTLRKHSQRDGSNTFTERLRCSCKICPTESRGFVQYKELIRPFKQLQEGDDSHTPQTSCEIQGQKVRRSSLHTEAVMWSKLPVETEIAERGSTAEQPLTSFLCLSNNALLD